MSYDRSVELELERVQNQLDPPAEYRRRLSVKAFLKVVVPVAVLTVAIIAVLWYFFGLQWWYVLIVLAAAVAIYREHYKWSRNHIACSPTDGVLHIEDHSHPFILLGINGSSDNTIPLDDVELDTPTVGFFDRWVFHCGVLIAGDKEIKDLKSINDLLAIQMYRESLKKESITLDKQQVSVQMAILQTLESMGRDLATVVAYITQSQPESPPISHTQPIPVATRHPVREAQEHDDAGSSDEDAPEK